MASRPGPPRTAAPAILLAVLAAAAGLLLVPPILFALGRTGAAPADLRLGPWSVGLRRPAKAGGEPVLQVVTLSPDGVREERRFFSRLALVRRGRAVRSLRLPAAGRVHTVPDRLETVITVTEPGGRVRITW